MDKQCENCGWWKWKRTTNGYGWCQNNTSEQYKQLLEFKNCDCPDFEDIDEANEEIAYDLQTREDR